MSEKIVLTVEQAKAIDELKRVLSYHTDDHRNGLLIKEKLNGGWKSESIIAANDIPFEKFVDALINGYVATKEEILWAELGREVGEFVEGDIGVGTPNNRYEDLSNLSTHYKNGSLKGFYPANSFIKFP